MTLTEAVAVFYPAGPLTLSSLRTAARAGDLAVRRVAGKDLTTPQAMRAMVKLCPAEKRSRPGSITVPTTAAGPSSTEGTRSAQAAAATKFRTLLGRTKADPNGNPSN
jgi:hypothetical protein